MLPEGRTFLIAGGSSGLGAACVRRLASRGANVIIADLDERRGVALAVELGERAAFAPTDVTDEGGVRYAVSLARDRFGGLQGAVVCAGILRAEKVLTRDGVGSLDAFRRVVEVNLVGTFNVVRLAADALRSSPEGDDGERGVIIMTSSIAAFESPWSSRLGSARMTWQPQRSDSVSLARVRKGSTSPWRRT